MRATVAVSVLIGVVVSGCGGGEDGKSCSVKERDGDVVVSCDDGSESRIPANGRLPDGGIVGCAVERSTAGVTVSCSDGSKVTIPSGADMDGGAACQVTERGDGDIAIDCPDGTTAVVPGGTDLDSLKLVGATTASCGTCHDSDRARAHFGVMTVESPDAGPIETCGTCHNESSLEPVSRAHARLELGTPGLRIALSNVRIDPTTRKPTVQVQLTDLASAPVAREGLSMSLVLSKVEPVTPAGGGAQVAGPYRTYLTRNAVQQNTPAYPTLDGGPGRTVQQPAAENTTTGKFTLIGPGVYDYTFNNALPAGYDAAATHVVAAYATRTVSGVRYVGNADLAFVPATPAATPLTRNIVRTETCNGCHNPLSAHGGSRQSVQLCLTCHTQGAVDPESNNAIDFNVMIHKIHMGKRLPSVGEGTPYRIIGNGLSVHDWSHAGFPQPVENCQSCHTASDGDRWITNGTHDACVSCHENVVNPSKTVAQGGHPFALQAGATCGNGSCHGPGTGNGRDALEAHVTGLNNGAAPVFSIEIVSVAVADADSAPAVRVRAQTGTKTSGPMTPVTSVDALSMLEAQINGPNTGYALNGNTLMRLPKAMLSNLAVADVPGEFTFSLPKTLRELVATAGDPETDSYTLSMRAQYDPTPSGAPDNDRVDMLRNPTAAFTAGETLKARASIAVTDKCNSCHGDLTAHGGANLAKNVEQCAMCHTGSLDTRVRQGANKQAGPTTSLRLATLIHRIHGGAIAERPYKVFGFSATGAPYPVLDFSEVGFPGDLRDCASCHAAGTYFLPLPEEDPPTRTVSLDANGVVIGQ